MKRRPSWWLVYDCYVCGARFAGWGWDEYRKGELKRLGLRLLFMVVLPFAMGCAINLIWPVVE